MMPAADCRCSGTTPAPRTKWIETLLQMTSPSSGGVMGMFRTKGEHMSNKRFGYARVFTTNQNEDQQVLDFLESGIEERDLLCGQAEWPQL